MSDVVSNLAAQCGLTPEQAQKGLGAILSLFKKSLSQEDFDKVKGAVPNSDQMMAAAAASGEEASGGVLGAIQGMAGKLFGGGDTSALISKLSGLGISADQLQSFLPKALEFLKTRLPEPVMKQISGLLPQPQEAAH